MGKSYSLVAIDTDALSYAHLKVGSTDECKLIGKKVQKFLKKRTEEGTQFVLPTIVLSEYLCIHDQSNYDSLIDELERDFILADFDPLAAKELAIIRKNKTILEEVRQATGRTKDDVKYDQLIASISLAAGATHILTGNQRDYGKLTGGRLRVIDIRTLPPFQLDIDDLSESS